MRKRTMLLLAALSGAACASAADAYFVGTNPPDALNITLNANGGDSKTQPSQRAGKPCLYMEDYGYFKVERAAVATTDNNLLVEVTFFDEGTGSLAFQYNSSDAGLNNPNYKQSSVPLSNSGEWATATIALTDAAFAGKQNGGADFRIAKGVCVSRIDISKGTLDYNAESVPTYKNAPEYAQFEGKSVAGYQMWFQTGDENSGWFHWNGTRPPSPGNLSFEIYPDVTEYPDAALAQTGFANLGNGEPAKLYDAANSDVIDTHFRWMADAHIDGVAVQRFTNGLGKSIVKSDGNKLVKVRKQAEQNERLFYVCYDISGTSEGSWADIIKFDWVYNVERALDLTASDAYAKVGNRPVVEVWGIGFTGDHPGSSDETLELIKWLQNRGCYVIGGVPTWWRQGTGDSKEGFYETYLALDMISPWFVGRFSDNAGADNFLRNPMTEDAKLCQQRGVDYMPTLCPGFAWSQWNGSSEENNTSGNVNNCPRNSGDFLWHQASNIMDLKEYGVKNMYFAMFDEYDEGTALIKAATDWSMIPTDQYFLTTSADGYWLSSDYTLRVAGAAIDMQKSGVKQTEIPVAHSEGPVYYRNSFESRTTPYNKVNGQYLKTGTFPLDPCFKNPEQISASGVTNQTAEMQLASTAGIAAKSGIYVTKFSGTANAAGASYLYKFADAKILVKKGTTLRFAKYAADDRGRYATVSLRFDDGTWLHNLALADLDGIGVGADNARGTVGAWTTHSVNVGQGSLVGKTITGIALAYAGNAAGTFTAYFDDLLIEDAAYDDDNDNNEGTAVSRPASDNDVRAVFVDNGTLHVVGYGNADIEIRSLTGSVLRRLSGVRGSAAWMLGSGVFVVKVQDASSSAYKVLVP